MIAPFAAPLDEIFTVLADAAIRSQSWRRFADRRRQSRFNSVCRHKNILDWQTLTAQESFADSGAEVVLRDHVEPVMISGNDPPASRNHERWPA